MYIYSWSVEKLWYWDIILKFYVNCSKYEILIVVVKMFLLWGLVMEKRGDQL